ncbi:DUF3231 family protein [Virgibacillus kekensis]|uniref:DUF3231 family protein n=1 Tax=Virgibacillus kekensis TaxID=202261 RepID=A0ABV9DKR0_9BACI
METKISSIPLTSADLSSLWNSYQIETMAICGISHFLQHVEDAEIQTLTEKALALAESHKTAIVGILSEENITIPHGFTKEDVDVEAPRLFSDTLYLEYLLNSTELYLNEYCTSFSMADHDNTIEYFSDVIQELKEFQLRAKQVSKEKGTYLRAPKVPFPEHVSFVKKQNFLSGWFGNRRPLLGQEIAQISYNAKRNALGLALMLGFKQVAKSKEVRNYLERGRSISQKHFDIFSSILKDDYITNNATPHLSEVTDSTVSPYSDRLIMSFISTLNGAGLAQYGKAMAASPRHDLGVHYSRLSAEIAHYAEDGVNLMIKNEWLEQPPISPDRDNLAKQR